MVEAHPVHERALPWLKQVRNGEDEGFVAAHTLAELYAILTTLPVQPRIPPATAQELIQRNVVDVLEVVALAADDYVAVLEQLSRFGLVGGVTYDALILWAARKADVDRIVTLNEKDFRRVSPKLVDRLVSP